MYTLLYPLNMSFFKFHHLMEDIKVHLDTYHVGVTFLMGSLLHMKGYTNVIGGCMGLNILCEVYML